MPNAKVHHITAERDLFRVLSEADPENDLFLLSSIYDLDVIRALYRLGVRNVRCEAEPEVWIGPDDREKAEGLERKYLRAGDYRPLKRLNRINMIFSYLMRETVMRSRPVQLQVETTSFCNAQCIMCGHYIYRNAIARHMDAGMSAQLDHYLKYAELVILHGYGEPFLHPRLAEDLKKYREYGVRAATNTNLSVLPDEILAMIPGLFSEMTVSIDGCTEEIYEGIRKGLSFAALLRNIARLNEAAPDLPKKIAMVIMRQNLHQIPDMVLFAKGHGFAAVNFIAMGSSPYAGNEGDEVRHYPHVLVRQLRKAAELARETGIALEMPLRLEAHREDPDEDALAAEWERIRGKRFFPDEREQQTLYERHVAPRLKELEAAGVTDHYSAYRSSAWDPELLRPLPESSCTGNCDCILMRPYIDLDGRVFACCLHTQRYMGEIGEDRPFESIWNGEHFQKMRSVFYNGKKPAYCGTCSFMDNDFLRLVEPGAADASGRGSR